MSINYTPGKFMPELLEEVRLSNSFKAWMMPDLEEDALRNAITSFCKKYNFSFVDEKAFNEIVALTKWELQRFSAHFEEHCKLKDCNKLKDSATANSDVSEDEVAKIDEHVENILSQRNSSKSRINKKLYNFLKIAEPIMKDMQTMCISSEITEHMHWLECELASHDHEFISIENRNFFPLKKIL